MLFLNFSSPEDASIIENLESEEQFLKEYIQPFFDSSFYKKNLKEEQSVFIILKNNFKKIKIKNNSIFLWNLKIKILFSVNFQYFLSILYKNNISNEKFYILHKNDNFDYLLFWIDNIFLIDRNKKDFYFIKNSQLLKKYEIDWTLLSDYLFLQNNGPFSLWQKKAIEFLNAINWLEFFNPNFKELEKTFNIQLLKRFKLLLEINKERINYYKNIKLEILNNLKTN